jgi:putative flippase GtrA
MNVIVSKIMCVWGDLEERFPWLAKCEKFIGFAFVGTLVMVIGFAVLIVLVEVFKVNKSLAGLLTTICSIQLNFLLNKKLNWSERHGNLFTQLGVFNLSRALSAGINQVIYNVLLFFGCYYLVATLLVTALATTTNYVVGDKVVFRSNRLRE